jgi:uncharacterized membrane protein YjgN (DUF898 family)
MIMNGKTSNFTGGAGMDFLYDLAITFLTALSLGIAAPWLTCWKQRWIAENTFIEGKQLEFSGKGGTLCLKMLLWILLTIVTLGIYSIWIPTEYRKFITENTHFKN